MPARGFRLEGRMLLALSKLASASTGSGSSPTYACISRRNSGRGRCRTSGKRSGSTFGESRRKAGICNFKRKSI